MCTGSYSQNIFYKGVTIVCKQVEYIINFFIQNIHMKGLDQKKEKKKPKKGAKK